MDIFYNTPFYGVPRLTAELKRRGFNINHKRVRRLQKALGLRTIYPRPHFNTSEPHPEHKKFPYLLKGLKIDHPNQVWSYGWSDKGATKIARIILKRFTNAREWDDYWLNKMNCIGNVVVNIGNYKCFSQNLGQ